MKYLVLALFSSSLLAGEIDRKNNRMVFDYSYLNSNITHEETSSSSEFTSLGEDTNLVLHNIGFGHEYELFPASLISITTHISAGIQSGEDIHYDTGASSEVDYAEKAQGYYGAIGASLNVNWHMKKFNAQFFAGARTFKSNTTYTLRYIDESTDTRSTEIAYRLDRTVLETSIGVRFIDYSKRSTFSTISINKVDITDDELSVDASSGSNNEFSLSNLAEFKHQDYSARLAIGILF